MSEKISNFSLPIEDNSVLSLDKAMGLRGLVLFFYPKDMTSGCTREAEDFAKAFEQFQRLGFNVMGISKDSSKSHQKFIEKHQLPFHLYADTETEVCQLFNVYKEKSMYGRKYMGVERSTFVIDAALVIQKAWRGVKVPGHVDAVLAHVQSMIEQDVE